MKSITRIFDLALAPFSGLHPMVGLLLVSVVTGVVMLIIFGKTSNQRKLAATKDRLKAHIMEIWLFRNEPRVMFGSLLRIGRFNLQYLRLSMVPLLFLIVPVVLIMVQLGIRYASTPLVPGQEAVVKVRLARGEVATLADIELVTPEGIEAVAPPLRIDLASEIDWKIRAREEGSRELVFETPDGPITKSVQVSAEPRIRALSSLRPRSWSWDALLYPVEPPLPKDARIRSIRIDYPDRDLSLLGLGLHWIVVFFVVSLAAGLALKGVLGIEV